MRLELFQPNYVSLLYAPIKSIAVSRPRNRLSLGRVRRPVICARLGGMPMLCPLNWAYVVFAMACEMMPYPHREIDPFGGVTIREIRVGPGLPLARRWQILQTDARGCILCVFFRHNIYYYTDPCRYISRERAGLINMLFWIVPQKYWRKTVS